MQAAGCGTSRASARLASLGRRALSAVGPPTEGQGCLQHLARVRCLGAAGPSCGPALRTSMTELPDTIWPSWAWALTFLRRWMLRSRSRLSLTKRSLENSHLSGSAFLKPCSAGPLVCSRQVQHHAASSRLWIKRRAHTTAADVAPVQARRSGARRGSLCRRAAHIGVELAHEGRKVVVLKVLRQQVPRELCRLLDHKAAPRAVRPATQAHSSSSSSRMAPLAGG